MGVSYPGMCSNTAHHWIGDEVVYQGSLFRCKHCNERLWLPIDCLDAADMGNKLRALGSEGYCNFLDKPENRSAKVMIAKLQELDRLSATMTDAYEMARIAIKILDQKEYDRR